MSKKLVAAWVPESTAKKIDEKVQNGDYISVSDYLRSLIRRELEEEA